MSQTRRCEKHCREHGLILIWETTPWEYQPDVPCPACEAEKERDELKARFAAIKAWEDHLPMWLWMEVNLIAQANWEIIERLSSSKVENDSREG